jgi:hypothetical protein
MTQFQDARRVIGCLHTPSVPKSFAPSARDPAPISTSQLSDRRREAYACPEMQKG